VLEVLSEREYRDRGRWRADRKGLRVWSNSEHRLTEVLDVRHGAIEASNEARAKGYEKVGTLYLTLKNSSLRR